VKTHCPEPEMRTIEMKRSEVVIQTIPIKFNETESPNIGTAQSLLNLAKEEDMLSLAIARNISY